MKQIIEEIAEPMSIYLSSSEKKNTKFRFDRFVFDLIFSFVLKAQSIADSIKMTHMFGLKDASDDIFHQNEICMK